MARAPSRDFGSSTMHTTNSSVNATTDLFSEIPTAQLLQKQSAPPFHSNSNNNRTTPSSIHPFVLEKNALSRHTKRLKGKGTTSKPLRRSSSMGPLVALNKGKKNVGEGSSGLRNTFKRRRSTTDLTGATVAGLIDEMREFYHQANKGQDGGVVYHALNVQQ